MQIEALTQYILAAMISWTPVHSLTAYGETDEQVHARFETIARNIASVAADPNEAAIFSGQSPRARTALLLASIGSFEGGWQRFVEEGHCNQTGFQADRRGNCDGGYAFTSWQIHVVGGGFLYVDGRLTNKFYAATYAKEHPDAVINGPRLLSDQKLAIRVAKDLIIETKGRDCLLCGYAGEPTFAAHPKADARLGRAKDYWARHPFADSEADTRQATNP